MSNTPFMQYAENLPKELVKSEKKTLANGFVRLCNPELYKDVLLDGYSVPDVIIFGTTVFGDFLVWEKQKYVNLVSFSKHSVTVLESGFDFFLGDIEDENYLKQHFDYDLYIEALRELEVCKEDECYTVNPIPAIGGIPSINKLRIGKLREYNAICIELAGKIE